MLELDMIQRYDAEQEALAIIDSGETDVTPAQLEEWGDYDLAVWLALWGVTWPAEAMGMVDAEERPAKLKPSIAETLLAAGYPTLFDEASLMFAPDSRETYILILAIMIAALLLFRYL